MSRAPRAIVRAFAIAAFTLIALTAGFDNAQAQICTGNFLVSNFNFNIACPSFNITTLWDSGDSCVDIINISANDTTQEAMCCALSNTVFDGVRIFGHDIGVGKTETFLTPCGCMRVSVTGPDMAGQYTITIRRLAPPEPPCI